MNKSLKRCGLMTKTSSWLTSEEMKKENRPWKNGDTPEAEWKLKCQGRKSIWTTQATFNRREAGIEPPTRPNSTSQRRSKTSSCSFPVLMRKRRNQLRRRSCWDLKVWWDPIYLTCRNMTIMDSGPHLVSRRDSCKPLMLTTMHYLQRRRKRHFQSFMRPMSMQKLWLSETQRQALWITRQSIVIMVTLTLRNQSCLKTASMATNFTIKWEDSKNKAAW